MFAWLDRHLERASSIVPNALWRLDRSMLEHYPLLWRSRVLPVLCIAALLTVAAAVAGLMVPMWSQTVWTEKEVSSAVNLFEMAMLIAAGLWATVQSRYSIGDRRRTELARVTLYSFMSLTALLLPPQAFYAGLSVRIAAVMTPQDLQRQIEFHRPRDYWCCTQIDQDAVTRNRAQLDELLAQLGLSTNGSLEGTHTPTGRIQISRTCPQLASFVWGKSDKPWSCLDMRDSKNQNRPTLLRERLASIETHQALASASVPHLLNAAAHRLAGWLIPVIACTLLLTLVEIPSYAWRRRFAAKRAPRPNGKSSKIFRLPAALQRFDHHLLLDRPVAWAAQVHVFLPYAVGLALLSLVILALPNWTWVLLVALAVILPAYWLVKCRKSTRLATQLEEIRTTLALYALASLALPLLIGVAIIVNLKGSSSIESIFGGAVFAAIAVALFVPAAVNASYAGWVNSVSGLVAATFLVLIPWPVIDLVGDWSISEDLVLVIMFASLASVWIIAERLALKRARRPVVNSARARFACAMLCATGPVIFGWLFTMFTGWFADTVLKSGSDKVGLALAVSATVLAIYLTLRWFLTATLTMLAQLSFAPDDA